jgi:tol-pal system protein YbgF
MRKGASPFFRITLYTIVIVLLSSFSNILAATNSYESRYNEGRSLFTSGKFTQSIRHFRNMIAQNDSHSLSDNCQYWIGEAYYRLGKYEQALLEFDKTLTFINNNKREDSLYKMAVCHEKLEEKKEAREIYIRLIAEFPETRHSSYVLKSLETLGLP